MSRLSEKEVKRKEVKRLATYKDMAYRSLRFLYLHPNVGPEKLSGWVDTWYGWMEADREAGKKVFSLL